MQPAPLINNVVGTPILWAIAPAKSVLLQKPKDDISSNDIVEHVDTDTPDVVTVGGHPHK